MSPATARLAVLTATWVSLIFFGFALFAHNRLYDKDLQRAMATEARLAARASGLNEGGAGRPAGRLDLAELALAQQPDVREPDARTVYDDGELDAFVAAKVRGPFEENPQARSLVPPGNVRATHATGGVTLDWDPRPVNEALASALARQGSDLRLGFRVYRGQDEAAPVLVQTLPWGTTSWRDTLLPLGRGRLVYEVWAVLVRDGPAGEVLVAAERSEAVTVQTPEHFTLALQGGSAEEAVFAVDVVLASARDQAVATGRVGDELRLGDLSLGLVVQSIAITTEERLATQRRLLFTTDGSLVLDPDTHQPRTTQTQILVPVQRLKVVLTSKDGETRLLETDLP
jgi:hypothetical protein